MEALAFRLGKQGAQAPEITSWPPLQAPVGMQQVYGGPTGAPQNSQPDG